MKYRYLIKLLLGILFIILLVFTGIRLFSTLTEFMIDMFTGAEVPDSGYENELVTPEPLPTMPDYMADDSFYDNAGSVDFNEMQ